MRRWLPFLIGTTVLSTLGVVVAHHGVGGGSVGGGSVGKGRAARAPTTGPRARLAAPLAMARGDAALEGAIARGVAYLVRAQNRDGSLGSPASNLWDIYAPVPGSFYAFQVAATSLALSGLLEVGDDSPAVRAAIRRATDFVLANHRTARRVSPDTLYNVWAQAYALEALARCLARETDAPRRRRLLEVSDEAVDLLVRFEFVDGGWGYYNFDLVTQRPEHGATSFTTAAVLTAMRMAADQGVRIPARIVTRALALLETCRKPDWSFAYAWDHRFSPSHPINKWNGSLARTPSCQVAMSQWGHPVPAGKIVEALERLKAQGRFLQIARKYPYPHETWFYNSGYFCFFGYYYASLLLDGLAAPDAALHRASIATYLTRPAGGGRLVLGLPTLLVSQGVRHGVRALRARPLPTAGDALTRVARGQIVRASSAIAATITTAANVRRSASAENRRDSRCPASPPATPNVAKRPARSHRTGVRTPSWSAASPAPQLSAMTSRLVATADRTSMPSVSTSAGTIRKPPPTPSNPVNAPATTPASATTSGPRRPPGAASATVSRAIRHAATSISAANRKRLHPLGHPRRQFPTREEGRRDAREHERQRREDPRGTAPDVHDECRERREADDGERRRLRDGEGKADDGAQQRNREDRPSAAEQAERESDERGRGDRHPGKRRARERERRTRERNTGERAAHRIGVRGSGPR